MKNVVMPCSVCRVSDRFRHLLVVAVVLTGLSAMLFAQDPNGGKEENPSANLVENPFPNRQPAPDLDGGVEWLNATGPISLKELRGKIVLIDFWTFCCINCMHVLPDLKYLEKKYPNELVVIGVHSAKFDNEKETGNIRKAILRYEIEHPVVNDANMLIWRKFGVNSWPSLVVIDPEGQFCGAAAGEGNREVLEKKAIEPLIAYHRAKRTLDETPLHFMLERAKSASSPLRFPGKVLVDEKRGRLFVSDSNHNRIVISRLDGKLMDVIGTGVIGRQDGSYAEAQFDHPQGMALVDDTLYVADTENHLLRTVDLSAKTVATLAGTGEQARSRSAGGPVKETALNSPWDLTVLHGILYVAMAGPHQIWAHQLGTSDIHQYAGSGREDVLNGDLQHAALAQPSGLVNDGRTLYVVDSEGSAVRGISTIVQNDLGSPSGTVTTIAGTHDLPRGRSLFAFGDVDDFGTKARFQHPLGIGLQGEELFVADSYNHKIKMIHLQNHRVKTWLGTGKSGNGLTPVELSEPAGISIAKDKVYIADTNNHRILLVDLATKSAAEFTIEGLKAPEDREVVPAASSAAADRSIKLEQQVLKSGSKIDFDVTFNLPKDFKLNELLPVTYRFKPEDGSDLIAADQWNVRKEAATSGRTATFSIPTSSTTGKVTLDITMVYGYCREVGGGVCKIGTVEWKIPISLQNEGTREQITLTVKAQ